MERTRTNTDRDQFKPDQYLIASDAIGFGMDPIYFEAPACRFVSIWHRFGLARIGIQPATPGFGSFRFDITLSPSDIALTQTDIEMTVRNCL